MDTIKEMSVNAVRILSAEQVTKAKSGHPGICMDAAPVGYLLYSEVMNYCNTAPDWENRDRFVLSAGHGSAMLYSLLHLFGFGLEKDDLMNFRQFGSKTPGHPEHGVTAGVDCSTGPLGQGIANAVGLALAEAHLAAVFNKKGYPVVDHFTYALCGEGCLEEGIGYEACSFAGTQRLGKLILFYDCNKISIEGNTDDAFADIIAVRFASQNWQVIDVPDVNDLQNLRQAVNQAKSDLTRPSIIICHSKIGYGTPVAGMAAAHGTPLNDEQVKATKDYFIWNEQPFEVPEAVKEHCRLCAERAAKAKTEWEKVFEDYSHNYPELAERYKEYFGGDTADFSDLYKTLKIEKPEATRISGGVIINEIAKRVPNLLSGSADLTPSTKTNLVGEEWFTPENRAGRNIHFGIREHAMAAICNGVVLHGGLKIICSTFFVFSDYMKGAMRMSAICKLPVIYVLTHDSIGVGEDGPTHEPIEQLAMLRATPNTNMFRPADRAESISAFISALNSNVPTVIALSRQNLNQKNVNGGERGGYIICDCKGKLDAIFIGTGSEVDVCIAAKDLLEKDGINARVVSMPCTEIFDKQSEKYRQSVLPKGVPCVCVEASSDNIWYKYGSKVLGMNSFGLSAPMEKLFKHFGFTPENVAKCLEYK